MDQQQKEKYISVDPNDASIPEVHKLLLGGIAPRPIALVSTISNDGINNLSPFSFFNAFGANPPIIAFSPARRGRDGTIKDTLKNLESTKECVVQSVSFDLVQQVSLASTEYPSDVDEFIKSGLTPIDSDIVKPKRVKESPFQMECRVNQIIPLGEKNASGNLVICEVVKFHYAESIMANGIIEPDFIDLVGRNSANYYTRSHGEAIFEIEKPITTKGIGIDKLPDHIKDSNILTGNNLGQLGNIESLPNKKDVQSFLDSFTKIKVLNDNINILLQENDYHKLFITGYSLALDSPDKAEIVIQFSAQRALKQNNTSFAINALLALTEIFE